MTGTPTFSVIVATRNPGECLRTALASVWAQRDADCELIVVDGGSTDGTLPWLESQRTRISTLITEPDRGVYDAMNKGVARARGEWVYFLGADDRLVDEHVLTRVAACSEANSADVIAGEARYTDGRRYRFEPAAPHVARNFIHHQAAFYRRGVFVRYGGFDASLAIAADYEFNLRLAQQGARFFATPVLVAICAAGGLSDGGRWRVYREEMAVRHRYFSTLRALPWDFGSLARFARKKIRYAFAPHA
jgi:glycosyltransferase involved in cell wall biosynthesis